MDIPPQLPAWIPISWISWIPQIPQITRISISFALSFGRTFPGNRIVGVPWGLGNAASIGFGESLPSLQMRFKSPFSASLGRR